MTPREVEELEDDEYVAFVAHMHEEAKEMAKAAKRRR